MNSPFFEVEGFILSVIGIRIRAKTRLERLGIIVVCFENVDSMHDEDLELELKFLALILFDVEMFASRTVVSVEVSAQHRL